MFSNDRSGAEIGRELSNEFQADPFYFIRNIHKMEDIIAKIVDLENEINDDIDKLVDLKAEITTVIKEVDDPELQSLLEQRYLNFRT